MDGIDSTSTHGQTDMVRSESITVWMVRASDTRDRFGSVRVARVHTVRCDDHTPIDGRTERTNGGSGDGMEELIHPPPCATGAVLPIDCVERRAAPL